MRRRNITTGGLLESLPWQNEPRYSREPFVSLQARQLVAREAIKSGGTRSCRANALTFRRPETLQFEGSSVLLVAVKPEGLAAHRMSKLKYIRSSA